MFFRHKNQNDQYRRLEEQLAAVAQDAADAKQKLGLLSDLSETVRQLKFNAAKTMDELDANVTQHLELLDARVIQHLGEVETHFTQLHSDIHKHDMAIEDLLDEWSEKKSEEDTINIQLKKAGQAEQQLLELFEAYQEQFWNLKHYAASKDESWASQITLMEKTLEHYQRGSAISIIQASGVSVDYDLYDIIEVIDTADPALDKTIAEIYRCGYLYKGKVRKKAQAAAYRYAAAK